MRRILDGEHAGEPLAAFARYIAAQIPATYTTGHANPQKER